MSWLLKIKFEMKKRLLLIGLILVEWISVRSVPHDGHLNLKLKLDASLEMAPNWAKTPEILRGYLVKKNWSKTIESYCAGGSDYYALRMDDGAEVTLDLSRRLHRQLDKYLNKPVQLAGEWQATVKMPTDPMMQQPTMPANCPKFRVKKISLDKTAKPMTAYTYFQEVLCGTFDNSRQVANEQAAGKQIHPFAKHVTAVCNSKMLNLPADLKGYFILEESYYTYEGKPMEIKPYLFFIEEVAADKIRLSSYSLPTDIPKADITNANPNFILDYAKISVSKTFQPATYQLTDKAFTVNHPTELGNGMRFTLIETLTKDRLEVMELLEKDGKRLTPYETPIIYERVK